MLSAPGVDIVSSGGPKDINGYGISEGTSDSTAYVSAAAALIRAKYPDLTAGQVANRLVKTAEKPSTESPGRNDRYGYGSIRPLAALKEDIPKGSKYGPLAIPDRIKKGQEDAQQAVEDAKANEQNDRKQVIGLSAIGLVFLLIVGGIVALIVRASRKRRNNGPGGPGGPGAPGAYPYPPGQAPGYGVPPQQPAPPQQSPYNN